jgi:hypothetical protein
VKPVLKIIRNKEEVKKDAIDTDDYAQPQKKQKTFADILSDYFGNA